MTSVDVTFDFTSDTPGYWEGFWKTYDGIGYSKSDPDKSSPMLREYHRALWSKQLPNGEFMELKADSHKYLWWKNFCFGSDSITASFRYTRYRKTLDQVAVCLPDYRAFVENYIHRLYTIGGCIIFPMRRYGMNTARGFTRKICDRWDLTLECIRRFYAGENDTPLAKVIEADRAFYELFVDFKGYVDFFYLEDCVTPDYKNVKFWLGKGDFEENALPQTVDEYLWWIEAQINFVKKRNARILADYS